MYLKNRLYLIVLFAIIILIIYLYSSKKIESFEESKDLGFNLNYINRRKCIIAVSVPNNNTYTGTQNLSLGTIIKNKNIDNAYQPSINNINNNNTIQYFYILENQVQLLQTK